MKLIAYRLAEGDAGMPIVPADFDRAWMNGTPNGFAKRCLPLLIANASGWLCINTRGFNATWDMTNDPEGLRVEYHDRTPTHRLASSHFGSGVLTWNIPYLFRTEPGYNLLVRGPANHPKHGASPLEGIVETDWACATFTMNWQLTSTDPVMFEEGEPICQLVPQQRGELALFQPRIGSLAIEEPDTAKTYAEWSASRDHFNRIISQLGPKAWQKDYFQQSRQKRLNLQPFQE